MVSVDLSVVFELILLILFVITLNILLYKPFLRIMRDRKDWLDTMKKEIEATEEETVKLNVEFSAELRSATDASRVQIMSVLQQTEAGSRKVILETTRSCDTQIEEHRKQTDAAFEAEKRMTETRINELAALIRKKLIPCLVIFFCIIGGTTRGAESAHHAENATDHSAHDEGGISEIARIVDFVLMAGLLFYFLRKPVSSALSGRIQSIRDRIDTFQTQKTESTNRLADVREHQRQLPAERLRIEHETSRQVEQIQESQRAASNERIERLQQECLRQKASQEDSARRLLRCHIAQSAVDRVRQELEMGLDDATDRLIVADCIDRMKLYFSEKGGKIHV